MGAVCQDILAEETIILVNRISSPCVLLLSIYAFKMFYTSYTPIYLHRNILTAHLKNDRSLVETSYFTVNFYRHKLG